MPSSNILAPPRPVDKPVEKVDNSAILGIFAKEPVAGLVKTRLCPPLDFEQATELYCQILDETIRRFSGQFFDLVICYAGNEDFFAQNYPQIPRQPQQGADLGERMANALQGFLSAGYRQAILIGSDSPDLPLSHLEQAFVALQSTEVVIAPATDGGYVLIGENVHQPELFAKMPWSQADLMQQTKKLLAQQQISWQQLPVWEDIDDAISLIRLLQRSPDSLTASYVRDRLGFILPEKIDPQESRGLDLP